MVIIPSRLENFRSRNTIIKFCTIYSKFSYRSSEVQYFAVKNSHYCTFFPQLKRSFAKIVNLGFSVFFEGTKERTWISEISKFWNEFKSLKRLEL